MDRAAKGVDVPDRIRLGLCSPLVVLGVAARHGLLARAGLTIEEVPARCSTEQIAALLAGELDAVLTSADDVLGHLLAAPGSGGAELRILAAVDRGLGLSLFCAPDIDRARLRGGVLGVDTPASGCAFVGYELLARCGLRAGHDYQVRALGTTPGRAGALVAGEFAMTVLDAGSGLRAEAAGCTRIARATVLGPYLGTVLAGTAQQVRTPASAARLQALTRVIGAATRTLLAGGGARAAAQEAAARLGLAGEGVARYLRTLTDPAEGLVPDGRVDPAALATLRRLRERHGAGSDGLAALCAPGSPLVDGRFLAEPAA